jgi:hypothetical protein
MSEPLRDAGPIKGERKEIDRLAGLLTGTFAGDEVESRPGLTLHIAPVKVDGLPDSFLVELARADAPTIPFRMYVLQFYPRREELRVRTFELPASSGLKDAMTGLWASAQAIPTIDGALLAPSLDMPLIDRPAVGQPDVFVAQTEHVFPVNRLGAIEMTASMSFNGAWVRLADTGFDSYGKQRWASDSEQLGRQHAKAPVRSEPGGLTIITTVAPKSDAERHQAGGQITIAFTYWTAAGVKIQSNRDSGREPVKVRIPGGPFPALDTALSGIAKGERRKIVIPSALAYGDRGRDVVPPNSTLIYDIECLDVNNTPGPPPRQTTPAADPHQHASPPPSPPAADGPIGSPPTNGNPETPR